MLDKKKRGISELVSYVLLVVLTIALATGTYIWLKNVAVQPKIVECPDVNIIVSNYTCYAKEISSSGNITFLLENKGRFDINGFKIQISDRTDETGFKDIMIFNKERTSSIKNAYMEDINVSNSEEIFGVYSSINEIRTLKISPIKRIEGNVSYCKPFYFPINCITSQASRN